MTQALLTECSTFKLDYEYLASHDSKTGEPISENDYEKSGRAIIKVLSGIFPSG
jgi:hypothetical protein